MVIFHSCASLPEGNSMSHLWPKTLAPGSPKNLEANRTAPIPGLLPSRYPQTLAHLCGWIGCGLSPSLTAKKRLCDFREHVRDCGKHPTYRKNSPLLVLSLIYCYSNTYQTYHGDIHSLWWKIGQPSSASQMEKPSQIYHISQDSSWSTNWYLQCI